MFAGRLATKSRLFIGYCDSDLFGPTATTFLVWIERRLLVSRLVEFSRKFRDTAVAVQSHCFTFAKGSSATLLAGARNGSTNCFQGVATTLIFILHCMYGRSHCCTKWQELRH